MSLTYQQYRDVEADIAATVKRIKKEVKQERRTRALEDIANSLAGGRRRRVIRYF